MFIKNIYNFKLWKLLFLIPTITLAQSLPDHLVINEVMLDTTDMRSSWIEILNPTNESITLQSLFASSIRTPNLLPLDIKQKGGIEVGSREYIIICWDKNKFLSNYKVPKGTQVFEKLRYLKAGGALRIWSVKQNKNRIQDDILYGIPSSLIKSECINSIAITANHHTFSRFPDGFDSNNCIKDFIITSPTPGKKNINQ